MVKKNSKAQGSVAVTRRVIYGDTDAMGIVYYGNYLRFFEMGRNEYLRGHGVTAAELIERGIHMPVVEVLAKYHTPARYDDEIVVTTRLEKVERVRVSFTFRLTRAADGELLVVGSTVHACINVATGRAVRMPRDFRELLVAALSPAEDNGD
ncbi:MAG: hypothetical protein A2289_03060 [Deltaproteobacteria bacterium RIFOXYA12_FULL_58_15]|nr:MAG: hypothetical protein A2289_03060 [Deltaproteobacteria bacterium RIFOXYA12_FULL_58_15]